MIENVNDIIAEKVYSCKKKTKKKSIYRVYSEQSANLMTLVVVIIGSKGIFGREERPASS